jgi:hypothetical protein
MGRGGWKEYDFCRVARLNGANAARIEATPVSFWQS